MTLHAMYMHRDVVKAIFIQTGGPVNALPGDIKVEGHLKNKRKRALEPLAMARALNMHLVVPIIPLKQNIRE
jgi:hypothetical protein